MKERRIITGNEDDLKEFARYLRPNDENTVKSYFRKAKKTDAFLVVRRPQSAHPQMHVLVVPYKWADGKKDICDALRGKMPKWSGVIQALPIRAQTVFCFAEIFKKNDGGEIDEVLPPKLKRKRREDNV